MSQYVGRVSLKHLVSPDTSVEDSAREICLTFVAESNVSDAVFVFELGDIEREPHLHFYFKTTKGLTSLQNYLRTKFKLPPKVGAFK